MQPLFSIHLPWEYDSDFYPPIYASSKYIYLYITLLLESCNLGNILVKFQDRIMNTHAYFNSRTFEGIVSNLYSGDVENNLWGTNRKLEGNLKSKSSKSWFKIILHRLGIWTGCTNWVNFSFWSYVQCNKIIDLWKTRVKK